MIARRIAAVFDEPVTVLAYASPDINAPIGFVEIGDESYAIVEIDPDGEEAHVFHCADYELAHDHYTTRVAEMKVAGVATNITSTPVMLALA